MVVVGGVLGHGLAPYQILGNQTSHDWYIEENVLTNWLINYLIKQNAKMMFQSRWIWNLYTSDNGTMKMNIREVMKSTMSYNDVYYLGWVPTTKWKSQCVKIRIFTFLIHHITCNTLHCYVLVWWQELIFNLINI